MLKTGTTTTVSDWVGDDDMRDLVQWTLCPVCIAAGADVRWISLEAVGAYGLLMCGPHALHIREAVQAQAKVLELTTGKAPKWMKGVLA